MRRLRPLLLILLLCGLSGCGEISFAPGAKPAPAESVAVSSRTEEPAPAEAVDPRPEILRILAPAPTELDSACYAEVYETLFTLSEGERVPLLAGSEAEHESGSGEYRIALRSDICDSEGRPFTAADAAYSYSLYGEGDKLFLSAEVGEDGKLCLHFSRELSEKEGERWLCRVPLHTADELGTGPYRIAESDSDSLTLLPNEAYWGDKETKQNLQSIRYLYISGAPAQVMALETGKADAALQLGYADTEDFLPGGSYSDLFYTVDRYSGTGRYLLPNVGKGSAVEDEALRLALFGALDGNALADALGGRACTALGNPDLISPSEGFASYQTASSEVGDSGINRLSLTLLSPDGEEAQRTASAVQTQWESKGVRVRLFILADEEYREALAAAESWDMALVETESEGSAAEQWAELWAFERNNTQLRGKLNDATLQNLLQTVLDGTAASAESVQRLQERVYNHGFAYALPQLKEYLTVPQSMSRPVMNGEVLLPGSCVYE